LTVSLERGGRQSEDVVVVDKEGEVESEIDQGTEHRLSNQQNKVPHIVGDVVSVLEKRGDQAALVEQPGHLLEVEKEARNDVEDVD